MLIYLTRHGESIYNTKELLGGDSGLSVKGELYSNKLYEYFKNDINNLNLLTSNLVRTKQTASKFTKINYSLSCLDEIDAGIFDSKTYLYVKNNYPDEYLRRKNDKFNYVYPEGESYKKLKERVLNSLEYFNENKINLVICHNAVLRVLFSHFNNIPDQNMPHLEIPLHTLFKIEISDNNIKTDSIRLL